MSTSDLKVLEPIISKDNERLVAYLEHTHYVTKQNIMMHENEIKNDKEILKNLDFYQDVNTILTNSANNLFLKEDEIVIFKSIVDDENKSIEERRNLFTKKLEDVKVKLSEAKVKAKLYERALEICKN